MGSKIRAQKSIIVPLNLSKRFVRDHDHDPDEVNRLVLIANCKRRRYDLLSAEQERKHDEPEEEKGKKEIEVVVDGFNPNYVHRLEELESGSDSSDDHQQFRRVKLVTKRGHGGNFRFGDPLEALNTVYKLKCRQQSDDDSTTYQPHEEKTKHCEDEIEDQMYESDMLMHTLESTIRLVEKDIEFPRPKGRSVLLTDTEDYLQFKHLRCIENMYNDHRLDVITMMRKDPTAVLPVVLKRLVQKRGELIRFRRALRLGSSKSVEVPENYQAPQYTSHTMTR